MKKALLIALIAGFMVNAAANPNRNSWGAGVMVGEPTGLSLKIWTGSARSVNLGAAWSLSNPTSHLHLHADMAFYTFSVFPVNRGSLPLYYGLGALAQVGNEAKLGIRIPLGINYLFAYPQLDMFFEIAPVLLLIKETDFDLDAALGIRFFF